MPLTIHPDARKRLHEALTKALPTITVDNGMFIDRASSVLLLLGDIALPQKGRFREQLEEYIDEYPFANFVLDTLGEELWERDQYQKDVTLKLTEIAGYQNASELADRLLNQFATLPCKYQVTIELPAALQDILRPEQTTSEISPRIRFVRATEEFNAKYPLDTGKSRRNNRLRGGALFLWDGMPPKWSEGHVHLQIECEGFIGQYGTSATATSCERLLRSIFGMGLACQLFDFKYQYSPGRVPISAFVHQQSGVGEWMATTKYELADRTSQVLGNLALHALDGRVKPDEMPGWRAYQLKNISAVCRAGSRADPTILAGQWFFDSYGGDDSLLQFIQCMVVLEIILGDKSTANETGTGALISNRFAYLVGQTHEERTSLIEAIKHIYQVRSKIVHSGKNHLTGEERILLQRLRWMCRRAIDKEAELLRKGLQDSTVDAIQRP